MKLLVTAAVCGAFVAPPLPGDLRIPEQRFDLRDFGAKGDGSSLNTGAFEAAVAAIRSAGGGQLYVPPGTWVTTGFALASHMSLFLESGATIRGLANFSRDAASSVSSVALLTHACVRTHSIAPIHHTYPSYTLIPHTHHTH